MLKTLSIEWEARPSSPSSIRLIHFGKMLDDKAHLKGKEACQTPRGSLLTHDLACRQQVRGRYYTSRRSHDDQASGYGR